MNTLLRPKESLSDQVTSTLVSEIVNGVFKPGDRLPTGAELTKRFGVSLSVIRESIARLKADGLIDTRQGSGAFVADPSALRSFRIDANKFMERTAIREIYEFRIGIEAEAVSLAALRRTDTHLDAMQEALATIDEIAEDGGNTVDADMDLHRIIAEASGNQLFVELIDYLISKIRMGIEHSQHPGPRAEEHSAKVREEHIAIVDAIGVGDPESARMFARRHILNCLKRAEESFEVPDAG